MDLNPKGPELYKLVKYYPKQELPSTLTSEDPTLQQVTYGDNTILHVAANFKNTEAATKILDLDRSLLCKTNKKGDTPMHIAARLGCSEMVELLINCAKEDVEEGRKLLTTVNLEKDTALHVAVRKGHLGIVKLLIQEDKTLAMMINEAKESPLFLAVDREFYKIALEILKFECSVQGRKNIYALHAAVIRTHKCKSPQYIACLLPSLS
ncbi:ankyrin repeat-containing protein At5g02620-like [Fagus crenata]